MKITQSKSQTSIELLVILGILVLVFTSVLFLSGTLSQETSQLSENFDKTKECWSLSRKISNIYTNGDGGEVRLKTSNDIEFRNDTIIIDDLECHFLAPLRNNVNITGKISIKNSDNFIVITNY